MSLTIIGIDPGSRITGWGVIQEVSGVLTLLDCGVCKPSPKLEFAERLAFIFHDLVKIIQIHKPTEAAIEQVFAGNNVATAMKLGQARGVAVAACASFGLPVSDYEPRLVKKSLVGNGGAEKEQVAFMVGHLLNTKKKFALDTTDALGAAICHLNIRRLAKLGM